MPTDKARQDRFAQGVAAGHTIIEAASEAGFTSASWPYRLARKAEFQAKVAALALEDPVTGPSLTPVIAALMAGAQRAMDLENGIGMSAARGMLAEAARLKQMLPTQTAASRDLEMEWALKWGPKD